MKVLKVNAANEHGDTPLHLASRWGYGKLYSEASCYRGHVLRYPDDDVVSERITKFSFTFDFREPASFWRENMIAVVILLRVLARMSLYLQPLLLTWKMANDKRRATSNAGEKKWSRGRLCLLLFALFVHSICVRQLAF